MPNIPPPPDGSGIRYLQPQGNIPPPTDGSGIRKLSTAEIPPPPDGSAIVEAGKQSRGFLGSAADASQTWQMATHPVQTLGAVANAITHPVKTVQNMADTVGETIGENWSGDPRAALGKTGYALANKFAPGIGQTVENVKARKYLDAAGSAVGTLADIPAAMLGQKALSSAVGAAAEALPATGRAAARIGARTALKPNRTMGRIKIGRAIDQIIEEGTHFDKPGIKLAKANRQATGAEIGQTIKGGPDANTVAVGSAGKIEQLIDDLKKDYTKSERGAIDVAKDDIFETLTNPDGSLRDATYSELHDLKVKLQDAATRADKGAFRGGHDVSGRVDALKTAVGSAKDDLLGKFPELDSKYKRYSAESDAIEILEDAANRIGNREPGGGIIAHVAAATGGPKAWFTAKVLTDPALRLRLAVKLGKASGIGTKSANSRLLALVKEAGDMATDAAASEAVAGTYAETAGTTRDSTGRFYSERNRQNAKP